MGSRWRSVVAGLALLLLSQDTAFGQDRTNPKTAVDKLLNSLFQVRTIKEVAIAPNGKQVAWVEALPGEQHAASSHTAILVKYLDSSSDKPRRITAGKLDSFHEEHGIAWSPDSSQLVFLSAKEKSGQHQVYVASASSGVVKKLTNVKGALARPSWSPDSRLLSVLFAENSPASLGPLGPAHPDAGVVDERIYQQRLCLVDPDTGRLRPLSPGDLHVHEYDWSPDSKCLVAIAAHGSGDNNWYVAQLYTVSVTSGTTTSILKPAMQIAVPRWSPDGKSVAYIGGLMSDEGVIGGDIWTISASGGKPRNLTSEMKASASWFVWRPDSSILFTEHVDGASGIASLDPSSGRITTLWTGAETISAGGWSFSLSLSRDQKNGALIRHSFVNPPEVWVGPTGKWTKVTHDNERFHPAWGHAKSVHWKSDEFMVQGWLLYPRNFGPKRRYPMVVSVHGGPASAKRPGWPSPSFDPAILSSEGYFVLYPNPRGSYGQGEAFTRANIKDFGHGDLRDILTGVDEVVNSLPVDKNQLGIMGWSYGGYMTMWAVTHTKRFRAAVAGAGVSNWQSYYGQNGIDQWLIPYFGASVYDDPAVYARCSPINFIKQVRTPTLVLVGDRDVECPAPQSYEFWRALKRLGIPSQLVVYPNEGHMIAQPAHRRDIARRTVAWLNKYIRDSHKGREPRER
jgi:dipeptidyl aminopeptidase/acylaminoacyl peptidase